MRAFRIGLWAAIVVLGGFLAYTTVMWTVDPQGAARSYGVADIGGEFSAIDENGKPITHDDIKGQPHLIFFGFTHCPDVCPTTLYETGQWMEATGDAGKDLRAYMVTVDPQRDDPETLKGYLSAFDKRIGGITGTQEQIDVLLKKWRALATREPLEDGDYTMNHTATTYLMKSDGTFFGTIGYGEDAENAVRKLKRLVEAEG